MPDAPSIPLGTAMSQRGSLALEASRMKLLWSSSLLPTGGLPMASFMEYLYVGLQMRSR